MLEKDGCSRRERLRTLLLSFSLLLWPLATVTAEPTVIPTGEGQIGEMPMPQDVITGARFESIRGQAGELIFGRIVQPPSPAPGGFTFFTDRLHGLPTPTGVGDVLTAFDQVFEQTPSSARSRNGADDGDFVAFSFAVDGALPNTMTVRLRTFDETGATQIDVPVDTGIPTFPDPAFNKTAVAVDDQGRATVVYTEFDFVNPPVIKAKRLDATSGTVVDGTFPVTDGFNPGVALLDPAGDRLILPFTGLDNDVKGRVIDFSGAVPQVLPAFPISTTSGIANVLPAVAADPATGAFVVAWENIADLPGDPVNIRARRFDAMGNPVGNDFVVNTTTANAQGQADAAAGPQGETVIVWAGDATMAADKLDVFAQAYDAAGQPIGGEIKVNTTTAGIQDRPAVRFLPEPDAQGRPQFAVVWRDVAEDDGSQANGTGTSYRCFTIDGTGPPPPPAEIFADGFESGDTSSWSTRRE